LYITNAVGHRLLLMNEGRVEQIGTPLEVYEKPKTLFRSRIYRLSFHEFNSGPFRSKWQLGHFGRIASLAAE
jgi:ABC-type sugar transport system ATPase subunit